MHPDALVARLAERQFGVFSLKQAPAAGLSLEEVRYRVRIGRWKSVHRGVYLIAGTPLTPQGQIMAATLAAGQDAWASHTAAAFLFNLAGVDEPQFPIDVTLVRRRGLEVVGLRFHRPTAFLPADGTRVGPIPTTSPTRTLLDLAATMDPAGMEDVVDDALRRGLVRISTLNRRIAGRRGTRGIRALRALLHDLDMRRTESPLEARFLRLMRAAGLPAPEPQYKIRLNGRVVARVDFAFVGERVAVEIDGYTYHGGKRSFDSGHLRDQQIIDAGWFPLHFTDNQLTRSADRVVATVRRTLARRRRPS